MPTGPRPKPTALKLVSGAAKAHPERMNPDEPQPMEGIPLCPSKDRELRKVWDYTLAQLRGMRVVTMADRDALFAYCQAVLTHRQASEMIERQGLIVESPAGAQVANPALKIQRESATHIRAFGTEFGLTPSARTRIRVGDQGADGRQKGRDASRLLSG